MAALLFCPVGALQVSPGAQEVQMEAGVDGVVICWCKDRGPEAWIVIGHPAEA